MKQQIIKSLVKATGEKRVHLETPENAQFGDYSSNVAMQIASKQKNKKTKKQKDQSPITSYQSPHQEAEAIVKLLKEDKDLFEVVEKIDVAGPGFINFWLSKKQLMNELSSVNDKGKSYGTSDLLKDKKIMVEFAHPNTHKELHVGHMRTLILGESLSRIFSASGAKVFRANYQGDIGPHVAKAIWGTQKILEERKMSWDDAEKLGLAERAHLLGEGYVLANKEYEDKKAEIDELNTKLYIKDTDVVPMYERTRKWSLDYYDSLYKRFGTKFDRLYFESEVAEKGKEIVKENIGKVFEESEGAIIFDGEKYGLHKRVFITKDDNPTYEAKDMYLAPLQYSEFPFDLIIHVVANEQRGYFQVVIKALELLDTKFKGKEYHLPMGMVNLVGKKMSSRAGTIITVDELLDEVESLLEPLLSKELSQTERKTVLEKTTIAAVKYSMLKVNPESDVLFDTKVSVKMEGDSGPYLQYTFARTQSVIAKAKQKDIKTEKLKNNLAIEQYNNFNNEELSLLRTFIHYPEVVQETASNYAPNLICNYLFDLAQKYNAFYNAHRILDGAGKKVKGQESKSEFRVALTAATGTILKNGLNLLGIQAPEKM
jgi:arginyl-tRNA synthetase